MTSNLRCESESLFSLGYTHDLSSSVSDDPTFNFIQSLGLKLREVSYPDHCAPLDSLNTTDLLDSGTRQSDLRGILVSRNVLSGRENGIYQVSGIRHGPEENRHGIIPVVALNAGSSIRNFREIVDLLTVLRRIHLLLDDDPTLSDLYSFQASHKLQLMAHDPSAQKELGRLLANSTEVNSSLLTTYFSQVTRAVAEPASRGRHRNVFDHVMGYVENCSPESLKKSIQQFGDGNLPWHIPFLRLKQSVSATGDDWLQNQTYFDVPTISYQIKKQYWLERFFQNES